MFITAALTAAAGLLVVLFLDERPLRQQPEPEPVAVAQSRPHTVEHLGTHG